MFPLGTVLLPGAALPLQVFEPRYTQMISDCLSSEGEPEFGQTLITHGQEVGGGDTRASVGTIARIVEIDAIDETRYALVAVGVRRIKVDEWSIDNPYPVADVSDWPDVESDHSGLASRISELRNRVQTARELATRVGEGDGTSPLKISEQPLMATYNLAAAAPIGPADRLRLLSSPGPMDRLELLDEILDDVEAMRKFRLS